MAVEFKTAHKRTSEYNFAPEDIVIKADLNGRHEITDIEWLIADIVERGQLQPVVIRNDGGLPVLVAGFSRWRACMEINKRKLTPVPVRLRCSYFRGSEMEGFLANISENRLRNQTTAMDDAYNCRRLEQWGMELDAIAAHYREKPAWVKKRLSLLSLTEPAREAVANGVIKPTAAAEIAKLSEEKQREVVARANNGEHVRVSDAAAAGGSKKPTFSEVKTYLQGVVNTGLPEGLENAWNLAYRKKMTDAQEQAVRFFAEQTLRNIRGEE
jgi:ParB/RepB/Spo0J family partition protein